MKDAIFLGDTREVILGIQIRRVQRGLDPTDWKPMKSVGKGVREIRVRERSGAFRVIYVASFEDTVYVLHAFQKRSQRTPQRDLNLAVRRLSMLERQR